MRGGEGGKEGKKRNSEQGYTCVSCEGHDAARLALLLCARAQIETQAQRYGGCRCIIVELWKGREEDMKGGKGKRKKGT